MLEVPPGKRKERGERRRFDVSEKQEEQERETQRRGCQERDHRRRGGKCLD
jgi:hypothetical protein